MKQLYEENDNVIPLIWQGDSVDSSPGYSSRASLYGVGAIPHAQFQGNIADVGGGSTYPRYLNYYNNTINTESPVDIAVSLDFNAEGQLLVQGDIYLENDLTTTNNKIVFALTRNINSAYFASVAGYATEDLTLSLAEESGTFSHAFTLNPDWNLGDLKGIVMVQSWQNKYIIQAKATGFTGLLPLFAANVTSGPPALGVQFIDFSLPDGQIDSWEWDLNGDGNIDSTEQNPYFLYEEIGSYDVTLRITQDGEMQEIIKENFIEVSLDSPIHGNVSGVWKEIWNPYILSDDTVIQENDVLEIEPGVVIQINNESMFQVFGKLTAIGSVENPILFTSNDFWKGLRFSYSNQDNIIQHCHISKSNNTAIFINDSTVEILNNAIFENSSTSYAGAIELSSADNVIIKQNFISNNTSNSSTGGIGCTASSPLIANNIIVNNQANPDMPATAGALVLKNSSNATVLNNTISHNLASNALLVISSEPVIENSIVRHDGNILFETASLVTVNYSCISGNYIGMANIDADPLFYQPSSGDGADFSGFSGEWFLQENSPAIDAGNPDETHNDVEDPAYPGNPLWPAMGTLRNDMGAFGGFGFPNYSEFTETTEHTIPAAQQLAISIYPNPFNPETNISLQLPDEMKNQPITVSIFNIRGQLVKKLVENKILTTFTYQWQGKDNNGISVSSGVYFVSVSNGNSNISKKMILLK